MSKRAKKGAQGNKLKTSNGLPVGALINCADNSGAKNLCIIGVLGRSGRMNRLNSASVGDLVVCTVKKGVPKLRKKVFRAVVTRQRKMFRRENGGFVCFEDNAGVLLNTEKTMLGSVINGPVAKEAADLWPKIASAASSIM
ncbi:60S ribosomal protein L23 [Bonamia ostreae]|uniref:60S ribosomal protein L23 n=1 Tax=Bonamia ostreae TaxID=126728 RepID=A0ABV2AIQ3_9EUKA